VKKGVFPVMEGCDLGLQGGKVWGGAKRIVQKVSDGGKTRRGGPWQPLAKRAKRGVGNFQKLWTDPRKPRKKGGFLCGKPSVPGGVQGGGNPYRRGWNGNREPDRKEEPGKDEQFPVKKRWGENGVTEAQRISYSQGGFQKKEVAGKGRKRRDVLRRSKKIQRPKGKRKQERSTRVYSHGSKGQRQRVQGKKGTEKSRFCEPCKKKGRA